MAFTLTFTYTWEVVTFIKVAHKPELMHITQGLGFTLVLSTTSFFTHVLSPSRSLLTHINSMSQSATPPPPPPMIIGMNNTTITVFC